MSKRYEKDITITMNGDEIGRFKLTLKKILPPLRIKNPRDAVSDFNATIGSILGAKTSEWRKLKLKVSKRVPMRVLHQFYDGALHYAVYRARLLEDIAFGYSAERVLLKCLSSLPEFMVSYRFYLGLANDDGEFQVVNAKKERFTIEIQNPYDRLFSLGDRETVKKIRQEYGSPKVTVKGRKERLAVNDSGYFQFSFGKCLSTIISNKNDRVRKFLEASYKKIRIPEYHAGRIGDNAVFEVDEFVQSLRMSMNYLFTEDLDWPYKSKERGPFTVPILRIAGARPFVKGKVLLSQETLLAGPIVAPKYYRK